MCKTKLRRYVRIKCICQLTFFFAFDTLDSNIKCTHCFQMNRIIAQLLQMSVGHFRILLKLVVVRETLAARGLVTEIQ